MRRLRSIGAFWYDFLIGDRPELFVGSIVVLAAVWATIQLGLGPDIAGWLLAVAVLAVGALGVVIATRPRH